MLGWLLVETTSTNARTAWMSLVSTGLWQSQRDVIVQVLLKHLILHLIVLTLLLMLEEVHLSGAWGLLKAGTGGHELEFARSRRDLLLRATVSNRLWEVRCVSCRFEQVYLLLILGGLIGCLIMRELLLLCFVDVVWHQKLSWPYGHWVLVAFWLILFYQLLLLILNGSDQAWSRSPRFNTLNELGRPDPDFLVQTTSHLLVQDTLLIHGASTPVHTRSSSFLVLIHARAAIHDAIRKTFGSICISFAPHVLLQLVKECLVCVLS